MNAADAIRISLDTAEMIGLAYLQDLTDSELMMRPQQECNHINWQVGHLILSEHNMMDQIAPDFMPELPAAFDKMYDKQTAGLDDPEQFLCKEELLKAYRQQRDATLRFLEQSSEQELDLPTGIDYAPTRGSLITMQGSHWMMHCGQWVIVRRETGKPVVI